MYKVVTATGENATNPCFKFERIEDAMLEALDVQLDQCIPAYVMEIGTMNITKYRPVP